MTAKEIRDKSIARALQLILAMGENSGPDSVNVAKNFVSGIPDSVVAFEEAGKRPGIGSLQLLGDMAKNEAKGLYGLARNPQQFIDNPVSSFATLAPLALAMADITPGRVTRKEVIKNAVKSSKSTPKSLAVSPVENVFKQFRDIDPTEALKMLGEKTNRIY